MEFILTTNSKEIRDRLRENGFYICPCATWKKSCWLSVCSLNNMYNDVHGIGYSDEDGVSQDAEIRRIIEGINEACVTNSPDRFIEMLTAEREYRVALEDAQPKTDCGE